MNDTPGVEDATTTSVPLTSMRVADLQALAAELGIRGAARLRKQALVDAIEAARAAAEPEQAPAVETPAVEAEAPAQVELDALLPPPAADAAEEPAEPRGETAEPVEAEPVREAPVRESAAEAAQVEREAEAFALGEQIRTEAAKARAAQREETPALTLDDLVLPPARGEGEGEGAEPEDEESGRPVRKRGRGRGRRGRGAEGEQQDAEPTPPAEEPAEADEEPSGGRRRRGRGNGQNGQAQNGQGQQSQNGQADQGRQQGVQDQRDDSSDDDEQGEGRRGRGRYRDRKRGRGHGDDVDPEVLSDDVLLPIAGILDVLDNYAFVRTSGYLPGPNDVYVSLAQVKKYGLRKGDAIVGAIRQPREGEQQHGRQKYNAIVQFDTINGQTPDEAQERQQFDVLTPLYPQERFRLETAEARVTPRLIDLFAPVGKGARGLIVAPPKSGKSVVLQQIADSIAQNNPETHLMLVLVDERPEEVTNMQRTIHGEVVAATFDLPAEDHTTVAELAIERAKRLVELGHDVVVLLDSITQLCRAYNLTAPASGRILAGGVDASALYPAKRFFGAARNVENGGSLTILATAMVETGSRTDEVILEEFAGTGNMEVRLSREIADRRIFPALDIQHSSTLQEEDLLTPDEVEVTWSIRRALSGGEPQRALEAVLTRVAETSTNAEFLQSARQQPIEAAVNGKSAR